MLIHCDCYKHQSPKWNANCIIQIPFDEALLLIKQQPMLVVWVLFFLQGLWALDVYFVRHGARSPLVVPMKDVFGVGLQTITVQGKSQSYWYGKQLHHRHAHLPSSSLFVFSTPYPRTRTTAEYFLKGWFGIREEGRTPFQADPLSLPPSNLSIKPKKEFHYVNQHQYEYRIQDIPYIKDRVHRIYRKYHVEDPKSRFILKERVRRSTSLCNKFQSVVPGSCRTQSMNEFFNFVDVMNCLDYVNRTVPGVTRSDMQLPLDLINHTYKLLFQSQSFPSKGVRQDFLLTQELYDRNPFDVAVVFTHDTQMFYFLRSLLGIDGVFKMFDGNMVMNFLSCIHFKLEDGVARMFFNDKEFGLKRCGRVCTIERLFQIMNE